MFYVMYTIIRTSREIQGEFSFMGFAHLHCHTGYSLLEGTAMPEALVAMAKRLKMPALAMTDRNNLYGAVDFYSVEEHFGMASASLS